MSTLEILDHTGDKKITWDPTKTDEVNAARVKFAEQKAKGHLAYRLDADGNKGAVIREFEPSARRIVMAPQTVGG
jgi:hypothetical protein